jgi:mannose-6-phosphate isomerase-like protein (cupin superfamily)
MIGYVGKIEEETLANSYFRKVIFTGKHAQLVLMCLKPGEEIGMEVHETVDQFFRLEKGEAKFILNDEEHIVGNAGAVIVPAGTNHNVINNSQTEELKLYTVYSPPNHKDGTIHKTKAEAMASEEHY